MALQEDLANDYFRTDSYGHADLWTIGGNSIAGIFDSEYVEKLDSESELHTLLVQTTAAASIARQDSAVGPEGTFRVVGIQKQEDGATTIVVLEEIS